MDNHHLAIKDLCVSDPTQELRGINNGEETLQRIRIKKTESS